MLFTKLLERALGENIAITPRRASRFEHAEGAREAAEPAIVTAPAVPATLSEPEAAPPPRPTVAAVERPEADLSERLAALPVPMETPPARVESHTLHVVHEVAAAAPPVLIEGRPPRPAATPAPPAPAATREVRTEVRHETERERIRETRADRLTLERRLETLRVETRRERAAVERASVTEANHSPIPRNVRPPVDRVAAQRTTAIRETRAEAAKKALAPAQVPPPTPSAPSVSVTIGRVEIRAVSAPAPRGGSASRGPKQSLGEYLRQREGA